MHFSDRNMVYDLYLPLLLSAMKLASHFVVRKWMKLLLTVVVHTASMHSTVWTKFTPFYLSTSYLGPGTIYCKKGSGCGLRAYCWSNVCFCNSSRESHDSIICPDKGRIIASVTRVPSAGHMVSMLSLYKLRVASTDEYWCRSYKKRPHVWLMPYIYGSWSISWYPDQQALDL